MTSPAEANLEILADMEALSRRVAEWMLELAAVKDGIFAVCLSGGSTPKALYEHLGWTALSRSLPLAASALVLGRRAFRAAQ